MSSARSSAAEAGNATGGDGTSVAVLIPAFDEAATIAAVVRAALGSGLGPVTVIDDGSRDDTSAVAAAEGATVLRLDTNLGKGGAVAAGARQATQALVMLLDADLVGLTAQHITALAAPVLAGTADMARGVFKGGRLGTSLAQRITPQLNGQRCLSREALLAVPDLADSRYGIEVAITRYARSAGWTLAEVPLWGVTQVVKEEKRGLWRGVAVRLKMYAEILRTLVTGAGAARRD